MPNKIVTWSPTAQAQVAAIDRETALGILHAIDDYLTTASATLRSFVRRAETCSSGWGIIACSSSLKGRVPSRFSL